MFERTLRNLRSAHAFEGRETALAVSEEKGNENKEKEC